MLLQDRILGLLTQYPGASQADIRAALADCRPASIADAIVRLRNRGRIEAAGWGAYKLAHKTTPAPQARQPVHDGIRASLAKLMAGR